MVGKSLRPGPALLGWIGAARLLVWANSSSGDPEQGPRGAQPRDHPTRRASSQTLVKRVPHGDYYMMGDNRGNSEDSPCWGSEPQPWIIGTAFVTYWPLDRIGTL